MTWAWLLEVPKHVSYKNNDIVTTFDNLQITEQYNECGFSETSEFCRFHLNEFIKMYKCWITLNRNNQKPNQTIPFSWYKCHRQVIDLAEAFDTVHYEVILK